jgi:hypothetical protein
MRDWLGLALIAIGCGLLVSAVFKRRERMRPIEPAARIRPEFAAMGEIVRPLILFAVLFVSAKMTLFYAVLGGDRYLSPVDFGGFLFVMAAYCVWLVIATKRRPVAADPAPVPVVAASAAIAVAPQASAMAVAASVGQRLRHFASADE